MHSQGLLDAGFDEVFTDASGTAALNDYVAAVSRSPARRAPKLMGRPA